MFNFDALWKNDGREDNYMTRQPAIAVMVILVVAISAGIAMGMGAST